MKLRYCVFVRTVLYWWEQVCSWTWHSHSHWTLSFYWHVIGFFVRWWCKWVVDWLHSFTDVFCVVWSVSRLDWVFRLFLVRLQDLQCCQGRLGNCCLDSLHDDAVVNDVTWHRKLWYVQSSYSWLRWLTSKLHFWLCFMSVCFFVC